MSNLHFIHFIAFNLHL